MRADAYAPTRVRRVPLLIGPLNPDTLDSGLLLLDCW